jgi:hypothetical protein
LFTVPDYLETAKFRHIFPMLPADPRFYETEFSIRNWTFVLNAAPTPRHRRAESV